ncbi:OmpL47-type beta-barrel domain-containing protein [Elusimicrobiota bacterium]
MMRFTTAFILALLCAQNISAESKVIDHYKLNENPHFLNSPYGIAYDSIHNEVWVTGFYSKNIVILDPQAQKTKGSIPLPGAYPTYPTYISMGTNGKAYVQSSSKIYIFDIATKKAVNIITAAAVGAPTSYFVKIEADPIDPVIYVITRRYDSTNKQTYEKLVKYDVGLNKTIASIDLPSGYVGWGNDLAIDDTNVYLTQSKLIDAKYHSEVWVLSKQGLTPSQKLQLGPGSFAHGLTVDTQKNLLYVGDLYGKKISIYKKDPQGLSLNGNITEVTYPSELGLDVNSNKLYSLNVYHDRVTAIDTKTNTVLGTLPTGDHPTGIAIDSIQSKAFVNNYYSHSVSIFDLKTDSLLTEIDLKGYSAYDITFNPNNDKAYISAGVFNGILEWDPQTHIKGNFVSAKNLPGDFALFPDLNKAFLISPLASSSKIMSVDLSNNMLSQIDFYSAAGIAAWPQENKFLVTQRYNYNYQTYTASSDSTLKVFDASNNTLTATISLGQTWLYPKGVDVNPTDSSAYVVLYATHQVVKVDLTNNTIIKRIDVGFFPHDVAVNPKTNRIYVSNYGSNSVSVIDGESENVVATIKVGKSPNGISVNPQTNRIYVVNSMENSVSIISGKANKVTAIIPTQELPQRVRVNSKDNLVHVTNLLNGSITVIEDSMEGEDLTPPDISHTPITGPIDEDSNIKIAVQITDNVKVSVVTLTYWHPYDEQYITIPMTQTHGSTFEGSIPSKFLLESNGNVAYFIDATDFEGNGPPTGQGFGAPDKPNIINIDKDLALNWTHSFKKVYGGIYRMVPGPAAAIEDIRHDIPGLEIATGSEEYYPLGVGSGKPLGRWFLLGSNGDTVFWKDTQNDEAHSSINLADLDKDGEMDMVGGTTSGNQLQAFDRLGGWIWRYVLGSHAISTPAIEKVFPDSDALQVFGGSFDYYLRSIDGKTGKFNWAFDTEGLIWSSPAVGDIDGDGVKEVVVGSDSKYVFALNAQTGELKWSINLNSRVRASAALADLDKDGVLEVLIGSADKYFYCIDGKTGQIKWRFLTDASIIASAAVGDLDFDDNLEIVFGSADNHVYVLDHNGSLKWKTDVSASVLSSPALAKRDNAQRLDIYAFASDGRLLILNGNDGSIITGFGIGASVVSSPVIGDVDGDGKLEIFFQDRKGDDNDNYGDLFWSLKDEGSKVPAFQVEWRMFRSNKAHTGVYHGNKYLAAPPDDVKPPKELHTSWAWTSQDHLDRHIGFQKIELDTIKSYQVFVKGPQDADFYMEMEIPAGIDKATWGKSEYGTTVTNISDSGRIVYTLRNKGNDWAVGTFKAHVKVVNEENYVGPASQEAAIIHAGPLDIESVKGNPPRAILKSPLDDELGYINATVFKQPDSYAVGSKIIDKSSATLIVLDTIADKLVIGNTYYLQIIKKIHGEVEKASLSRQKFVFQGVPPDINPPTELDSGWAWTSQDHLDRHFSFKKFEDDALKSYRVYVKGPQDNDFHMEMEIPADISEATWGKSEFGTTVTNISNSGRIVYTLRNKGNDWPIGAYKMIVKSVNKSDFDGPASNESQVIHAGPLDIISVAGNPPRATWSGPLSDIAGYINATVFKQPDSYSVGSKIIDKSTSTEIILDTIADKLVIGTTYYLQIIKKIHGEIEQASLSRQKFVFKVFPPIIDPPTNINSGWSWSSSDDLTRQVGFDKIDSADVKSYRVFIKGPGEQDFHMEMEIPADISEAKWGKSEYGTTILLIGNTGHVTYALRKKGHEWPVGEYQMHVRAVNAADIEGPASEEARIISAGSLDILDVKGNPPQVTFAGPLDDISGYINASVFSQPNSYGVGSKIISKSTATTITLDTLKQDLVIGATYYVQVLKKTVYDPQKASLSRKKFAFIAVSPDNVPPQSKISVSGERGESDFYISSVTVTLSATDDVSGVDAMFRSINDSVFLQYVGPVTLGNGKHTLKFYAIDKTGNKEDTQTLDIPVDRTAPTSLITGPGNGTIHKHVIPMIEGTAQDLVSGIASVSVSIQRKDNGLYLNGDSWTEEPFWMLAEGGASWKIQIDSSAFTDGIFHIRSKAKDAAGHEEDAKTYRIFTFYTPIPKVTEINASWAWSSSDHLDRGLSFKKVDSDLVKSYRIYIKHPQTPNAVKEIEIPADISEAKWDKSEYGTTVINESNGRISYTLRNKGNDWQTGVYRMFVHAVNHFNIHGPISDEGRLIHSGPLDILKVEGNPPKVTFNSPLDNESGYINATVFSEPNSHSLGSKILHKSMDTTITLDTIASKLEQNTTYYVQVIKKVFTDIEEKASLSRSKFAFQLPLPLINPPASVSISWAFNGGDNLDRNFKFKKIDSSAVKSYRIYVKGANDQDFHMEMEIPASISKPQWVDTQYGRSFTSIVNGYITYALRHKGHAWLADTYSMHVKAVNKEGVAGPASKEFKAINAGVLDISQVTGDPAVAAFSGPLDNAAGRINATVFAQPASHAIKSHIFANTTATELTLDPAIYTLAYDTTYYLQLAKHIFHANGDKTVSANKSKFKFMIETPDTTPPETSATISGTKGDNDYFVSIATVTLTAADARSQISKTLLRTGTDAWLDYIHPITLGEGEHKVEFRSIDSQGNQEEIKSLNAKVDIAPAQTKADISGDKSEDGAYILKATLTLSASDSFSGVANTFISINGSSVDFYKEPIVLTEGEHKIKFHSQDNAGNMEDTQEIAVTVRKHGNARAKIKIPKNGKTIRGNAVTVMAEASPETKGVLFQIRPDNNQNWEEITSIDMKFPYVVYWNVSALPNGKYWVRALAHDKNNLPDKNPEPIFVIVDDVNVDIVEDGNPEVDPNKSHKKTEVVHPMAAQEVVMGDGTKAMVPKGAIDKEERLVIRAVPQQEVAPQLPPAQSSLKPIGIFREYTFESGKKFFENPITITLPYLDNNDDGIVDGTDIRVSELKIYYFNDNTGKWEKVKSQSPASTSMKSLTFEGLESSNTGKHVQANVDHFTLFGLFAERAATSVADVIVYPNPVLPSKGHNLTFDGLPKYAHIEIYTMAGRSVIGKDMPDGGKWEWDLKTSAGKPAASGAYFYLVRDPAGQIYKGKVAIVR